MKRILSSGAILLACFAGNSMAACTDPPVTGPALSALIAGSTVCASLGGDQWQEQHRSGAELWDYKKGPTDAVDPTEKVGMWQVIPASPRNPDLVEYDYGMGGIYRYTVHGTGPYSFCSFPGATVQIHNATIKPSITSCP